MHPKANKTSFKPGHYTHHARWGVYLLCLYCSNIFRTPRCLQFQRKFCSHECFCLYKSKHGKSEKCYQLAKKGLTNKKIALKLKIPMGSVGSYLNRKKYRRESKEGLSYAAQIKRFKKNKNCEICGFDRAVEAAHIIPASKGGTIDNTNLIVLCPNHHYLFDQKKLLKEEAEKLQHKLIDYVIYTKRGNYAGA